MAASTQNVLATSTDGWIKDQTIDSFFDSTETAMKIYKSPSKYNTDGGDRVVWSAQVAEITGTAAIASGADYSGSVSANTQFAQKANLAWKRYAKPYRHDKMDFDVFNKGKARVINLSMGALDTLKNSFKSKISTDLWAVHSVANDEFVSLRDSITDTGSALTTTYAGIDTAVATKWKSIETNLLGNEITISQVQSTLNDLRFRRKAKPTLIVTGFARYNALQAEALGAIRHPAVSYGKTEELGIDTMKISGVPIVVDPYLEDSAGDGAYANTDPRFYAGSRCIYILSTDEIALVPQPAGQITDAYKSVEGMFWLTDWVDLSPILNIDRYQVNMQMTACLAVVNRRHQAVLFNTAV